MLLLIRTDSFSYEQYTYLFLLKLIWRSILVLTLLFPRSSKELFWFRPVFVLFLFLLLLVFFLYIKSAMLHRFFFITIT